ncbi:MAG: hypothetical protein GQ532_07245 [Methylomarinum sp.]|nr:hypothetical protein [Methylomarinum sp.]
MSRTFFISIKPELGDISSITIEQAYQRLGLNTGNLLFTNAVWSQLDYEKAESGFVFDPAYVNENFDHVVIPAANWLFEKFDFTDLTILIEQLTIPVVMIGVGAQAGVDQVIPDLPEGSVRLIKAVSERSALIGARGDFSAEVLDYYGIKNVEVIGCPSLYMGHNGNLKICKSDLDKIMIGGTRYHLSSHDKSDLGKFQRSIYQLAFREGLDINYQSERPEFDFIISGGAEISPKILNEICKYYGCDDTQELFSYFSNHGNVFVNVDEWITVMNKYDFYIGSRIHGVIAMLLSGTPACLLTHDSRTKELADFASIPSFSQDEIGELTMDVVEDIYNGIDFDSFQNTIKQKYPDYIRFLDANALPHNLVR